MPSTKSIKLSVVIVSYNVKELLMACLGSLRKYIPFEHEVWVADNNSSDGSCDEIRKKFPEVNLIENKSNPGFSAANNQCLEKVKGEYIFLLNPDAELIDDSLLQLMEFLENNKEKNILLGPALLNGDRTAQNSCWKFPSVFQHVLELFFLSNIIDTTLYSKEELRSAKEVDFVSGAAILFHSNVLEKTGFLDANLFWMDDVDFCKRVKLSGGKVLFFPGSAVVHHVGKSSAKNYPVVISNQVISKLKFYRKHGQWGNFSLAIPVFFLQICTRIPLFFLAGFIRPVYHKKCIAYCYTFKRFFQYLLFNKQAVT